MLINENLTDKFSSATENIARPAILIFTSLLIFTQEQKSTFRNLGRYGVYFLENVNRAKAPRAMHRAWRVCRFYSLAFIVNERTERGRDEELACFDRNSTGFQLLSTKFFFMATSPRCPPRENCQLNPFRLANPVSKAQKRLIFMRDNKNRATAETTYQLDSYCQITLCLYV